MPQPIQDSAGFGRMAAAGAPVVEPSTDARNSDAPTAEMSDDERADRIAGAAAIAASGCWLAWALVNTTTSGGLEHGAPGSGALTAAGLLTAGWNLLLVPALLRLHRALVAESEALAPILSVAGLLSLSFWAFGGLTTNTGPLETVYLALGAIWLIGIGGLLRRRHTAFGAFTLVVGAFTALDATFTLFEPMPFALYALAAPKLPLSAAWSAVTGIMLISGRLNMETRRSEIHPRH